MEFIRRMKRKVKRDNEKGARKSVLEDLFYDFNSSRFEVYKMNFFRGVFFGFGSVLGGTVVIAFVVWTLNVTGNLVPGVAGFVDDITQTIKQGRN